MTGSYIATTTEDDVQWLMAAGQSLGLAVAQLRHHLANSLSPAHGTLLAEPVEDIAGRTTDWYAPGEGSATPLDQLAPGPRATMTNTVWALLRDIHAEGVRLGASADADERVLGAMLEKVSHVPDLSFVRVRGGEPVLIAWAHGRAGQSIDLAQTLAPVAIPPARPPPRAPLPANPSTPTWLLPVLILAAIVLAVGLFVWWQRQPGQTAATSPAPLTPPTEITQAAPTPPTPTAPPPTVSGTTTQATTTSTAPPAAPASTSSPATSATQSASAATPLPSPPAAKPPAPDHPQADATPTATPPTAKPPSATPSTATATPDGTPPGAPASSGTAAHQQAETTPSATPPAAAATPPASSGSSTQHQQAETTPSAAPPAAAETPSASASSSSSTQHQQAETTPSATPPAAAETPSASASSSSSTPHQQAEATPSATPPAAAEKPPASSTSSSTQHQQADATPPAAPAPTPPADDAPPPPPRASAQLPPHISEAPRTLHPFTTASVHDHDLALLKGCWNLRGSFATADVETRAAAEVSNWRTCFNQPEPGTATLSGTQSLGWADGKSCSGPVTARFLPDDQLEITDASECLGDRTLFRMTEQCARKDDAALICAWTAHDRATNADLHGDGLSLTPAH